MKPLLFLLASLLCVVFPLQAQPSHSQPFVPGGSLTDVFHLKERCYGMSAVAVDDFIYLFGGDTPDVPVGTIERIDTRNNSIETLPSRLSPRYFSATARIGDSIYIFGGAQLVNPFASASSIVERFDISTGKVTTLARAPHPLSMSSAAVVRDKIYVLGRPKPTEKLDVYNTPLWTYNPESDTWTSLPPSPFGHTTSHMVEKDGGLYIIGGFGFGNSEKADNYEYYDTATSQWHSLPNLPLPMKGYGAAVVGSSLMVFGDYTDMGRVGCFNLENRTWRPLHFTGFDARRFPTVCVVKNKIYVMGGKLDSTGNYLDEIQVFDLEKLKPEL